MGSTNRTIMNMSVTQQTTTSFPHTIMSLTQHHCKNWRNTRFGRTFEFHHFIRNFLTLILDEIKNKWKRYQQ